MGILMNFLIFVAIATTIGLGTAWHMVEYGNHFSLQKLGPWTSWHSAGNPLADPYTQAHFARSGQLPLTSTTARYFRALADDSGRRLTTRCEYVIDGHPLDAKWWSVAIYSSNGTSFKNKSGRFAFNSENIFLNQNGTFRIRVAKKARPGNWLPTNGNDHFEIMLRVYRPSRPETIGTGKLAEDRLPKITRTEC